MSLSDLLSSLKEAQTNHFEVTAGTLFLRSVSVATSKKVKTTPLVRVSECEEALEIARAAHGRGELMEWGLDEPGKASDPFTTHHRSSFN